MNDSIHDVAARLLAVALTTAQLYSLFGGPHPWWTLAAALTTGVATLWWLEMEGDI